MMHAGVKIHSTAEASERAEIGEGTSIWHQAQVREGARIGRNCILAKGVYVDAGVSLGDNVKVQNYVSIYHGVTIEDGVFCGPHCVFTNDKRPRAINADGSLKAADDWELTPTLVKRGASIGANVVIVCGVTVGEWAMIGSGSVVSRDVPDYGLVWGNPARLHGFVCSCGHRLQEDKETKGQGDKGMILLRCSECGMVVEVRKADWEQVR
jgi:UDP-2-acetamido-3-amino-2,3-dideoxy-glucuronate N-acetyltransferase